MQMDLTTHKISYLYGRGTKTTTASNLTPMKAIRAKCLDCSAGSAKEVKLCGVSGCPLWPYRHGKRPETIIDRFGPWLMTPRVTPPADVDLTKMPVGIAAASEWLRERHPEIEWEGPKEPDPGRVERGRRAMARLQATQRGAREIDSGAELTEPAPRLAPRKAK